MWNNRLDGVCHLGVIQHNSVFIIFSFFVWHGCVKFKVSDPQNFRQGKGVCYQFCSEIYGLQEQTGVTDFSRMARPKSAPDLHHWARWTVQRWRHWCGCARVDWKHWKHEFQKSKLLAIYTFVQVANKLGGLYPFQTLYSIVCGLKYFLVEKNG